MNTTTTTSVASLVTSTIISDDVADRISSDFDSIVHLAQTHLGAVMPEGATKSEMWEIAIQSAFKAHSRFRKAKKEERVREFRIGCEKVIAAARQDMATAMSEYASLSPTLKAMMPTPAFAAPVDTSGKAKPIMCEIPVSDFSDIFPDGTKAERILALLKDMSYTIRKADKVHYVSVPFAVETVANVPTLVARNKATNAA